MLSRCSVDAANGELIIDIDPAANGFTPIIHRASLPTTVYTALGLQLSGATTLVLGGLVHET